jgi:serine/threonine-protein kinase
MEARDRITGEGVAVKIFASAALGTGRDALLRFEREARALSQLRHPNVVELRAYHPEGPALVLAWMAGGSLADRLRGEAIAPARAVEIACALLSALGEAHRLGILHRDVKPSNVLFDEIGTARLSDFGAAHLGDLSSTATAGAIGTFAYMSPEQRLGRPATLASDLYAVGAVLAELLTGEAPAPAVAGRLARAPSAANPDLTEAHDAAVARLLAEEPAARPSDAFEARRALLALAWPERICPRALRPSARPSARPADAGDRAERLGEAAEPGDGRDVAARRHDGWLGRDVLVLPLTDEELGRARAIARAGHPALPAVLRVDLAAEEIWVAPPLGGALADAPRGLSTGQRARLAEAIAALHDAGGAHGWIDAQHVYVHDGDVTLAYPRGPALDDAAERDLEALRRLDESALD